MNTKPSLEELLADKGALSEVLSLLPPEDILGRMSLESRLKEVDAGIEELTTTPRVTAETILYFGGDPVFGSIGINVDFAADALKAYQRLVAAVYASERHTTPLSESGQIPLQESSTLQIVGTPRGSFGFSLQEKPGQGRLTESALFTSVEKANTLLAASANGSESEFEDLLSEEPVRIFKEINSFWEVIDAAKASMRLKSSGTDAQISVDKISKAHSWTQSIEKTEKTDISKTGIFKGARAVSRDFNFLPDDEPLIKGKLSKAIEERFVTTMNTEFQEKRCEATFTLLQTRKKEGGREISKWTLEDIRLC